MSGDKFRLREKTTEDLITWISGYKPTTPGDMLDKAILKAISTVPKPIARAFP